MSMFPFDFSAAPLAPRRRGTRRLSATAVDDSVILDGLAGGSADDPAKEVGGVAQLDSAGRRLAFRELGLSIGLRAIERIRDLIQNNRSLFNDSLFRQIESLAAYEALIEPVERFWCEPTHQQSAGWRAHRDINMVMLATSLSPEEFLFL